MNARHQHLRDLNVLREALCRMAAHGGTFTISVGAAIDSDFLYDEIPPSVPRLVARLVEKELLLRVGHDGYAVPENGEQALLELTKVVRRAHPLLEDAVTSVPPQEKAPGLPYLERLLGADILTEPNANANDDAGCGHDA